MQKKISTNGFYINYVVCKSREDINKIIDNLRFYINYVVCKFELTPSIPRNVPRFILTMWYVNDNRLSYIRSNR